MTTFQTTIANAILDAKQVIAAMLAGGFSEPKQIFAATNMIAEKYSLTQEQAVMIFESALKIA